MASMRGTAATSYDDKMQRMGLGSGGRGQKIRTAAMGEDEGVGHVLPAEDGTQGKYGNGYADSYKSQEANEEMVAWHKAKPRLDRPGYKKGGRVKGTTVNVIVAPQNAPKVAPMMPPPGAGALPPPMPPGPPGMGGPGGPMGGLPGAGAMPRKKGGRVPMDAGAGSGEGRLEKIAAYGKNARKKGGK